MTEKTIKNWKTHLLMHGSYNGNGFVCDMDCKFRKLYPVPLEAIASETREKMHLSATKYEPLSKEVEKNVDIWFIMKK